jgi:hypothetical protein
LHTILDFYGNGDAIQEPPVGKTNRYGLK